MRVRLSLWYHDYVYLKSSEVERFLQDMVSRDCKLNESENVNESESVNESAMVYKK